MFTRLSTWGAVLLTACTLAFAAPTAPLGESKQVPASSVPERSEKASCESSAKLQTADLGLVANREPKCCGQCIVGGDGPHRNKRGCSIKDTNGNSFCNPCDY